MHRINTSRQTLSAKQRTCNYRPNGAIAQHILTSTVAYESDKAVVAGRIHEDGILAGVQIKANELFFLAASKFPGRYYVINEYGECSATDDRVVAAKVAQVQVYRMQKEAA